MSFLFVYVFFFLLFMLFCRCKVFRKKKKNDPNTLNYYTTKMVLDCLIKFLVWQNKTLSATINNDPDV